jgi:hypothetical protein
MKKTIIQRLLCILVLLAASSCATLFKSKTEQVNITSNLPGAKIYVNGVYRGKTSAVTTQLHLTAKSPQVIELRKEGYTRSTFRISTHISRVWAIVDLVFFGFPIVIDAITGNWNTLNRHSVHITAPNGLQEVGPTTIPLDESLPPPTESPEPLQ